MAYDSDSLMKLRQEARLRQQQFALMPRPIHEQKVPQIEMLVSRWHIDELGNKAREIKARD